MSFYRMAVYKTYAPRIYPTRFQRNSHPSVCTSIWYKKSPPAWAEGPMLKNFRVF